MLAAILKPYSGRLRDAAKNLSIWALNDGNSFCIWRSYHNGKKQNLFARGITLKNSINLIKRSTYAAASHPDLSNLSSNSVRPCDDGKEFLRKHGITVKGRDIPEPILSIEQAEFPDFVNQILRKHNVITPTPIQSVAWPIVLSGRDFVGISPTGSGKTLAFAIPAIMHVKKMKEDDKNRGNISPMAMILAPTRELAQQIEEVFQWFQSQSVRCIAVYGGVGKHYQLKEIYKGVDVLIATPGRCYDLLTSGDIQLDKCSFLVLDEADRMLDMGFLPQIEPIVESINCEKQSLMWSATWPKEVVDIASKFLSEYIQISVGSVDLKPNTNVKQRVVMCSDTQDKRDKLIEFLNEVTASSDAKVLIFVETKSYVDSLTYILKAKGFRVTSVHGGKSQRYRDNSLNNFRIGRTKVLIATAVAARGLDVDNITHVVNYDCPKASEEYIHKIGRTGRHNKTGEAVTFVTPDDDFAGYLVDMLRQSNEEVPQEILRLKKISNASRYGSNDKYRRTPFFFKNRRQNFTKSSSRDIYR